MPKSISKNQKEEIIALYKNGYGTCLIEKHTKISRTSIVKILRAAGIWEKGNRPWKQLHNINFFSKYTKESCYWAGFILADGNISSKRKALRICLSKKDSNHLQKFLDCLSCNGTIYNNQMNNSSSIQISGKWLVDDLGLKFDIFSRKSLTANFTDKIPSKYISDFVRGYFDGDGCLTQTKRLGRNKNRVILDFTGNKNVLKKISHVLHLCIGVPIPKVYKWKKRNCCRLGYNSRENVKNILEWMYGLSSASTRLNRKYEKYLLYSSAGLLELGRTK